jgi:cytochrome c-type biogenesis protein CcmH
MFWIFATLLVVLALVIILPPLFKKTAFDTDARRQQNIQIAKEQLAELETAFSNKKMQKDEYLARRDELEQSLYSDVDTDETTKTQYSKSSVVSSVLIGLLIPAITFGMYAKYGDSKSADPETTKIAKKVPMKANGEPDIDAMVSGLRNKLDANPDNAEGWYMLGRSYMAIKRYSDAVYAYEKLFKLEPNDAKIMLFLADASAMANDGNVAGRPAELVEKSLKLEPNNTTGLWLGGMVASKQGQHAKAIERWTSLLPLLEKQPQQIDEVKSLIAAAKQKMSPNAIADLPETANYNTSTTTSTAIAKQQPQSDVNSKSIVVTVSLADGLKSRVNASDSVFIYAKAMSGPPMPLAAKRLQVKDLPITIILDDSSAMIPAMKLSAFPQVKLGARVSKSGNAIGVNGDLYTEKQDVTIGSKHNLVIDSILQK